VATELSTFIDWPETGLWEVLTMAKNAYPPNTIIRVRPTVYSCAGIGWTRRTSREGYEPARQRNYKNLDGSRWRVLPFYLAFDVKQRRYSLICLGLRCLSSRRWITTCDPCRCLPCKVSWASKYCLPVRRSTQRCVWSGLSCERESLGIRYVHLSLLRISRLMPCNADLRQSQRRTSSIQ
jgi:hypothetical protein